MTKMLPNIYLKTQKGTQKKKKSARSFKAKRQSSLKKKSSWFSESFQVRFDKWP